MSPTFQAWEIHWSWGVERGRVRHLASCGPSFPVGWGWVMGGAMPLGLIVFSFQATTPSSPLWVVMGTSLVGTMEGIWWRQPYLCLFLSLSLGRLFLGCCKQGGPDYPAQIWGWGREPQGIPWSGFTAIWRKEGVTAMTGIEWQLTPMDPSRHLWFRPSERSPSSCLGN